MEIEFIVEEKRKRDTPMGIAIIMILFLGLFIWMITWRLTHPQPEEPPRELTQGERTSQALTLAGVAAAGNPGTAVYTPMLFALASNVKEGDSTNANLHATE